MRTRLTLLLLIVLSLSSYAYGIDKFNVSLVGMNLASIADGIATHHARQNGAWEANPLLRESGRAWPVVKLASVGLSTWGLYELHKRKPKLAWAISIGTTGAFAYLAYRNSRLK